MSEAFSNRPASLADYLTILRRRIWVIVIPLVLAPIVTFLIAERQKAVYAASASVYINRTPATSAATGIYDQSASQDPVRFFQTQAVLARDPTLINSVAKSEKMSRGGFASISSVTPSTVADLLIFSVHDRDPARAATLANAYARAFTRYKPAQDAKAISDALTTVRKKMTSLRVRGVSTKSQVYVDLLDRESQLETGLALQSGNVPQLVQPAVGAAKVSPRPKHDAILGLALGVILGIGLAFLGEALDKRVRSEREVEDILGLPLLARLPTPPRRLRRADELPILVEPRSAAAEAAKKLRTNLEFLNPERKARAIMITSAIEEEGKSTTIAELAVALARAGRHVALVDFDLRKPYLHRFFRIGQTPGVTDVAAGRWELEKAMKAVHVPDADRASSRLAPYLNASDDTPNLLGVLPAGTLGPDPADLVGSRGVEALFQELKNDWDVVLVDAPPLPAVDDGLALSVLMDALLVVTRFGMVPRRMLQELSRLLDASPADVLGFVLTGSERGGYGYGYGYGYGHGRKGKTEDSPVIQVAAREGERPQSAWLRR